LSKEYSREAKPTDEPFYPVRLAGEQAILQEYRNAACQSSGVSFVGRLATFKYIDMDVAIAEGLAAARGILQAYATGASVPAFFGAPG
jgi:UDP-galactopyranose mutase